MQRVINEEEGFGIIGSTKYTGFSVSENYFEDLEAKILERTIYAEKEAVKVVPLYKKKSFYASAANIAAVFVLFLSILNFEKITPVQASSLHNVELTSLENYIEEGNIDFSSSEISSFFDDANYTTEIDVSGIENEDLIEYFDQYTEPTLLME